MKSIQYRLENRSLKGRSPWAEPGRAVWWLWLWTVSPSSVWQKSHGRKVNPQHRTAPLQSCTAGVCETSPTFPSTPTLATVQLRPVYWGCMGCKKPSRCPVSFHEPTHLHLLSSNLVRVKPSTAPRIMESLFWFWVTTRMLLGITQHPGFLPKFSFCYFMPELKQEAWQLLAL